MLNGQRSGVIYTGTSHALRILRDVPSAVLVPIFRASDGSLFFCSFIRAELLRARVVAGSGVGFLRHGSDVQC